jgi:hypothetical protein|tara:strand:- start:93 stop:665 length:573 start_codon:yes stop_codon:yes gene_type:complete
MAQDSITIVPSWGAEKIELNHTYGDSFSFSKIRFYISNVGFYNEELNEDYLSKKQAYLMDISNVQMLKIPTPDSFHFTHLRFTLGIDSNTNSQGALSEDLDPIHGMYWTWQSGYINTKIEGSRGDEKFTYHLGGYSFPYNASQEVMLPVSNKTLPFQLQAIGSIDQLNIMRPSNEAIYLSEKIAQSFNPK